MPKYFILALSLFLYNSIAWTQNINKDIVLNKTFVRQVSSSCKSFKDKGCLITTYEALDFKSDSIFVYYYTTNDCEPNNILANKDKNTKAYSYQIQKKRNSPNYIIRINNFSISNLEATPNQLTEFINDPSLQDQKRIVFDIKKE